MTDEQKAPVAIRITRPYATEQEYLEREFDTLTRTSVVLLGAQARPQGVVLRFEIVLKNGDSILRGEGRVVGFKEKAYGGESGLSLRFTRLDARSKGLVDQAAALRDARLRGSLMGPPAAVAPRSVPSSPPSSPSVEPARTPPASPAAPPRPSRRAPPPLPAWARSQIPPAPTALSVADLEIEATQVNANFHPEPLPPIQVDEPPPVPQLRQPPPGPAAEEAPYQPPFEPLPPPPLPSPRVSATAEHSGGDGGSSPRAVAPPADREAFLSRLRARARSLPESRIGEILTKRVSPP